MTQSLELTENELAILKLFISRENLALENSKINPRRRYKGVLPGGLHSDHFYSYRSDIFERLTKKVYATPEEKGNYSEVYRGYTKDIKVMASQTVGDICIKFFDMEIIGQVKERLEKNQITTLYFLKHDFEVFKQVLSLILHNCKQYDRIEILGYSYFKTNITEDLVRTILFEKQASVLGKIDILDWTPDEIPKVLAILENKKEGQQTGFEEKIREQIKEKMNNELNQDNNSSDLLFSPFFEYLIPIFPESKLPKEKLQIMEKSNQFNKNEKLAFTLFPSVFDNHFKIVEQERLILPILALILCSPEALREFVFGEWKSFELPHGIFHKGNEKSYNALFRRLITLAISDVECTLTIPENKNIKSFEVREIPQKLTIDGCY